MKEKVIFIAICLVLTLSLFLVFKPSHKKEEVKKTEEKVEVVEKVETEKRMSIAMVGDSLIHGAVYLDASIGNGNYDFTSMFTYIEPMIKDYDLKYVNQESIIGGKNLGVSHYPRLNSPDEIGDALVSAGFNVVGLANNHSLDKGTAGLLYSTNYWKGKGVVYSGTNTTQEEQDTITIHEENGIKYAFLSYTTATNGLIPEEGYYVNVYDEERVKQDIEAASEADVIIVAMHWGSEYTHTPTAEETEIATYLSSLGVDLIIGTHPHVIQPIAYVGDTLVIYSLGNFISAQHPLGLEKIIGLFVGVDIVLKDGKVTFENLNYELLYTYCEPGYQNFSVIPFSQLTDDKLANHEAINQQYLEIVKREGL